MLKIFVVINLIFSVYANEPFECGEKAREHAVHQAFTACQNAKAVKTANEFQHHIKSLEKNGYCTLLDCPENSSKNDHLKALCEDPNGFLCSRKSGMLMNSKCQFVHLEPDDISGTPSALEIQCAFKKTELDIIKSHQHECQALNEECDLSLKIKYKDEILNAEKKLAYTPERVKRFKDAFYRVKNKYIEKLKKTSLVSKKQLSTIIAQIEKTEIDLPPLNTDCANTPPGGPESGLYYSPNDKNVHICIGAMATLDYQNELDLLHGMGHELSHAIDPCTLADVFKNDPELGISAYNGLVQCLRGGLGHDGCKNSVIFCNTKKGVEEACIESIDARGNYPKAERRRLINDCNEVSKKYGACPISKNDVNPPTMNLATYRNEGENISQLQEAFADYMGSEVVSDLVVEDTKSGLMTRQDHIDGIAALASDYVGLHGRCINENTKDVHPAPFLRLNRIIMGSKAFRTSVGCGNYPPKTKGANMTCQGL